MTDSTTNPARDLTDGQADRLLSMLADYAPCRAAQDPTRCAVHGGPMYGDDACQTHIVLEEVKAERARQFRQYGTNDDLQDGTGRQARWLKPYTGAPAFIVERQLRDEYEEYEKTYGAPTWARLVREEIAEAFAESNPVRLRAELLQVAALAVSWVETLDTRDPAEAGA